DTGHTHTHTHAGRGEFIFCFFPSWTVLPQGPPRSSGQLCSARGPSEVNCPSLVRDGHEFCYFACFYCWGSLVNTGRTCKNTNSFLSPATAHLPRQGHIQLGLLGRSDGDEGLLLEGLYVA